MGSARDPRLFTSTRVMGTRRLGRGGVCTEAANTITVYTRTISWPPLYNVVCMQEQCSKTRVTAGRVSDSSPHMEAMFDVVWSGEYNIWRKPTYIVSGVKCL